MSPRSRSSACRSWADRNPLDSLSNAEIALRCRVERTPIGFPGVVTWSSFPGVAHGGLDDVQQVVVKKLVQNFPTLPVGRHHVG